MMIPITFTLQIDLCSKWILPPPFSLIWSTYQPCFNPFIKAVDEN